MLANEVFFATSRTGARSAAALFSPLCRRVNRAIRKSIKEAMVMSVTRRGNGNYDARHEILDLAVEKLEEAPGLRCLVQERGTLQFLPCAGLIGYLDLNGTEIRNETDFADYLLYGFAVNVTVPHNGLSGRPCIGLPLTKSAAELESVCNRIIAACVALLSEL